MLPVLYNSPEFRDLPLKQRQKAACLARQRAFRHWQMWASLVALCGCVIAGSVALSFIWQHPSASTNGATAGAVVGGLIYRRMLFRFGLPYYREILSSHESVDA
jgi:hypothetical protein